MKVTIENTMQTKEEFKAYESTVESVIKWALIHLKANEVEIPNGEIKAIIRDNLIVDFSFEGLPQDFQEQFLSVLRGYRIV